MERYDADTWRLTVLRLSRLLSKKIMPDNGIRTEERQNQDEGSVSANAA